ncbi:VCBS domain-containing protein, partial [Aphanothece microscopica]|uniref:VCBS domain-containing protein n=1 Tax=Aphanothece microscopica TaxID=1049561 RepID=UPI0039846B22
PIAVNLALGIGLGAEAQGDVLIDIENLEGGAGADSLVGSFAANRIQGGAGNDRIEGLEGADTLEGGAGADLLDGGEDRDTASYQRSASAVSVSLATGLGSGGDAEGDTLIGIESLRGGRGDDTLTGSDTGNWLIGWAGADSLSGLGGNDTLEGGAGGDVLDGGDGFDIIVYAGIAAAVSVDLGAGTAVGGDATGDTLRAIEGVIGGRGDDSLVGSTDANRLAGANGADTLRGLEGDDTLIGGAGADILDGGSGNDLASYASSTDSVTINLITGTAAGGHAEGDVLTDIEHLEGGTAGDSLFGSNVANIIRGAGGDDTLFGGGGNDTLAGGGGIDEVWVAGLFVDYEVTILGTATTVRDINPGDGDEGLDRLAGVEYLVFADGFRLSLNWANTAASITGTASGAVTADTGDIASGSLAVVDPDAGEARFATPASLDGLYGTFTFDALTGAWTYDLNDSETAVRQLAGGETLQDTIGVHSYDGSASERITVTITGVNDDAVISGMTAGLVATDATRSILGFVQVVDADAGEDVFAEPASLLGDYGEFTFDVTSGSWRYDLSPDAPAVLALAPGATLTDTLEIASIDGTASATITITIRGALPPLLAADLDPARGFVLIGPNDDSGFGYSVASAGDINGDGFDDLIIGALGGAGDVNGAGLAFVVFGKASASGVLDSEGRLVRNRAG